MSLRYEEFFLGIMRAPALLYLAFAAPFTILMVWLIPPFQVPDEGHHYLRSVAISSGQFLPSNDPEKGSGGVVDDNAASFINHYLHMPFRPKGKLTLANLEAGDADGFGGSRSFHDFAAATVYPPYTYAAPALAVAVARSASLSQLDALRLARLASAFVVVVSATLAIALVPVGAWSVMAICVLPMFVAQSAGVTSDGAVFGLSLLAVAMIARCAVAERVVPITLFLLAALIAANAAIRIPMIALVLPLAVVGWGKLPYRGTKRLLTLGGVVFIALAPAIAWLQFAMSRQVDARLFKATDIDPLRQGEFILHNVAAVVGIARDTLVSYSPYYAMQFIGVLGFLDTPLKAPFVSPYAVFATLLIAIVLVETSFRGHLTKRVSAAFLAALLSAGAFVFASLYIGWTPVGYGLVQGVQGRYFLPIALALVIALSGTSVDEVGWRSYALPTMLTLLYGYSMPITVWSVVDRFYLK